MIQYESDGVNLFINLLKVYGSVFPKALKISIPASLLTGVLVAVIYEFKMLDYFKDTNAVMNNNAVWGGFSSLVGFLVVFRTSQAYSRFWEGCTSTHKMGAEWFDSCSSLMAFCKASTANEDSVLNFQNTLIRLFSMLHAAALGEIEDCGERQNYANVTAFRMELIDGIALDQETIRSIRDSDAKVELIFTWIQQLIVENIKSGVLTIAPPILTRSFQEIANGMVHFHDALKISNVPFPFPYAQTCDMLLVLHWLIVHFVVSQWCQHYYWAVLFTFIQVFTLWSLNFIAVELENPFGTDPNDIDGTKMQLQMNNQLRLLLRATTMHTPTLQVVAGLTQRDMANRVIDEPEDYKLSFFDLWEAMSPVDEVVTTPRRFEVAGRYKDSRPTTVCSCDDPRNWKSMRGRASASQRQRPSDQSTAGVGSSWLNGTWEPFGSDYLRARHDDVRGGRGTTSSTVSGVVQGHDLPRDGRPMAKVQAQEDPSGAKSRRSRDRSRVNFKEAPAMESIPSVDQQEDELDLQLEDGMRQPRPREHSRGRKPRGLRAASEAEVEAESELPEEHEIAI